MVLIPIVTGLINQLITGGATLYESINQSIIQSTNQSIKSINQSNQSLNQSINESIKSINQIKSNPINQSIKSNQIINQSINQSNRKGHLWIANNSSTALYDCWWSISSQYHARRCTPVKRIRLWLHPTANDMSTINNKCKQVSRDKKITVYMYIIKNYICIIYHMYNISCTPAEAMQFTPSCSTSLISSVSADSRLVESAIESAGSSK